MNGITRNLGTPVLNSLVALILVLSVGLACGLRKPWRDYKARPFDSQEWRKGDRITRGTMYFDLFEKHTVNGKTRDEVRQLLGDPDKKTSSEGLEVWLYRIDIIGEWDRPCFPVSFRNDKAFAGRVKGGTMSMIVEE